MTLYKGIEMHCFSLACIEEETYFLSCGLDFVEKRLSFFDRMLHQSDIVGKFKFGEFLGRDSTGSLSRKNVNPILVHICVEKFLKVETLNLLF